MNISFHLLAFFNFFTESFIIFTVQILNSYIRLFSVNIRSYLKQNALKEEAYLCHILKGQGHGMVSVLVRTLQHMTSWWECIKGGEIMLSDCKPQIREGILYKK
jgi:hypothetical protein